MNFLTKKRVENRGLVLQYYVEGSNEPIIPKKLFMCVQEEMVRRSYLATGTGNRRVYSGKYALSSIVYCTYCSDVFQRTHWNVHGRKKIVWRCVSRLHKKNREFDCPDRTVMEADFHTAMVQAIREVPWQSQHLCRLATLPLNHMRWRFMSRAPWNNVFLTGHLQRSGGH